MYLRHFSEPDTGTFTLAVALVKMLMNLIPLDMRFYNHLFSTFDSPYF